MNNDDFLFVEKYRPRTVEDCILPTRIKKTFQEFVDKKEIPNLILTGPAGVGKTSIAIAMCEEIDCNYMIINSSEERGIDTLRTKITGYASTVSLTGGHKVIILDEADGLTIDAQNALRGAIEKFAGNCSFILTCNFKAKLIDAIHSRCSVIDFTLNKTERPLMASKFFKRISQILEEEEIDFDQATVIKIIEKFFPDYRRTINELQRYSSSGKIDSSVLDQLADIRNLSELIKALRGKDFSAMRKWVVQNSDVDTNRIFRKIYDGLYDYLKPDSIPQAVVVIARYQFQGSFVPDQEINLCAALTELMVDCNFKD